MAMVNKNKKINSVVVILTSIVGAIFYRMGGSGNFPRQARCVGVALLGVGLLAFLYPLSFGWEIFLSYFLTFGLYLASLTTYWKKKGSSAKWWNWLLTGLGYSLAFLPFTIVSGYWFGFVLRSLVVAIGTMVWSCMIDNAVWEECGRGTITTITIPLLLL